jgi:hypothetical protein
MSGDGKPSFVLRFRSLDSLVTSVAREIAADDPGADNDHQTRITKSSKN